jgi:signal transduction histidine kinase
MNHIYDYIWIVVSLLVMGLVAYQLLKTPKVSKDETIPPVKADPDSIPFSRLTEIIETERNRIASELHDELGTLLSVIHLDLELVLRESSALTPHDARSARVALPIAARG